MVSSCRKTMTQQEDGHGDHADSDHGGGGAVAPLLMEARRLVAQLRACLQLHRLSSSSTPMSPMVAMDNLPLAAVGGGAGGALPPLVEGIDEALSRAIMLLPQLHSTGAGWPPVMAPPPPPPASRRGSGGCKIKRAELPQGGYRKELRSSMDQDDGYAWRKYGQKQIFAAKYPRSYFRCKHKYDRQCSATRQVQRLEADPSMVEVTYIGDHTCTQPHKAAAAAAATTLVGERVDPSSSSWQHHPWPSPAAAAASSPPAHPGIVKHEVEVAPSPSAVSIRRDHDDQLVLAVQHDGGRGGAPVLTFDVHAGADSILGSCCYTDDACYYYPAGAGAGDDELDAAAATIWEWELRSNTYTDY